MNKGETDILHGDMQNDQFLLIRENGEYLVVHSDYFSQESAVVFLIPFILSDWSTQMLIDFAKSTVDLLNSQPNSPL